MKWNIGGFQKQKFYDSFPLLCPIRLGGLLCIDELADAEELLQFMISQLRIGVGIAVANYGVLVKIQHKE